MTCYYIIRGLGWRSLDGNHRYVAWRYIQLKRRGYPFPPGPPADPILGHLRVIPLTNMPEKYHEWSKIYGDVLYLSVLGTSIVVLNSEQAASDLLEKRSAIYSDRPQAPMHDLIGWSDMLGLLSYTDERNVALTYQGSEKFKDLQVAHAHTLLSKFLECPQKFEHHVRRFAAAVVMEITYGHRIMSDDDPYIEIAQGVNQIVADAGNPGMTPVDLLPFLKYLPAWFPGAWFIRVARDAQPMIAKFRNYPYNEVKRQMADGTAKVSFLSMHLEELARQGKQTPEDINAVKVAAFQLFGAGGDTTFSALLTFILAMLHHPEIQKKAQEEIDKVVGNDRLVDFSDRDALPYINCVLWEAIRWHQAAPLGVPRRAMSDDVYKGMFIPKGSMIVANMRAITLEENVYAEPHKFCPERYLPKPAGNSEPFPTFTFGHGRRICPGRFLAENSLWIAAASILSAFNISRARDSKGKEIVPKLEFVNALISHPKPFQCEIRPRFERTASLVHNAVHDDSLDAEARNILAD